MNHKLRQLRLQRGISQTFISKRLGFKHPSGYANIEMGRNRLSYKNAVIIAQILNVSIEELNDEKFFEEELHNTGNTVA
ncbi:helix-turn-helix transcriptional regulator [Cohnella xylanilytica]|uniref:Helix-turn-helix transcriptional regulator n=1 Tax=Cohnella xylanilytica TaxID=557555 RepID=A0A841U0V7_9BACL|nr:helix-turn-helix transcriptional regulator [Cohnella xylanilytica]MBB6694417.1 helix-turn-helix transcriptional regulator [Cohnella xylanilytica]